MAEEDMALAAEAGEASSAASPSASVSASSPGAALLASVSSAFSSASGAEPSEGRASKASARLLAFSDDSSLGAFDEDLAADHGAGGGGRGAGAGGWAAGRRLLLVASAAFAASALALGVAVARSSPESLGSAVGRKNGRNEVVGLDAPLFPTGKLGLDGTVKVTTTYTTTTTRTVTWTSTTRTTTTLGVTVPPVTSPKPKTLEDSWSTFGSASDAAKAAASSSDTSSSWKEPKGGNDFNLFNGDTADGGDYKGDRVGDAGQTKMMTGAECMTLKENQQLPADFPAQCSESWGKFMADRSVKEECELLDEWRHITHSKDDPSKLASTDPKDTTGNCHIDPKTHRMICKKEGSCSGGEAKSATIAKVVQNVTYNCGASCKGALRVDCCETCRSYLNRPQDLGVDNVICLGCAEEEIAEAIDNDPACSLVEGKFECASKGKCASGVAEASCSMTHMECQVVPCDRCSNDNFRAQCCLGCLSRMCDPGEPSRMVCQGCDKLPGHGGGGGGGFFGLFGR